MAKESEEKTTKTDTAQGDAPASEGGAEEEASSKKKKKKAISKTGKEQSAVKKSPLVKKKTAKLAKPVPKKGSPVRNIILFVALVGGLALAFALLGNQTGGGGTVAQPKWKIGESFDVTITLVTPDYKDLECAMKEPIAGRHCAYESQGRVFPQKDRNARTNSNLLQPFTAVKPQEVRFLAAGMWTSEVLKKKLDKEDFDRPSPRFNVTCKYKVEGKVKDAKIRWKPNGGWQPADGWFTGSLSDCKIGS